jgi:hypothetical protein
MADKQLPIPDATKNDAKSFELLRVLVASKQQHLSLRVGVWNDPTAWGILLAHVARHVANSYQQHAELDPLGVLTRIKAGFCAELGSPTDEPSGQIVH